MQQRDRDILEHIIRYCDRIAGYLDKIENSKARFLEDQMCQDACCMCIAQIGLTCLGGRSRIRVTFMCIIMAVLIWNMYGIPWTRISRY